MYCINKDVENPITKLINYTHSTSFKESNQH